MVQPNDALVVVDSLYGNTRAVAEAIAAGLPENGPVERGTATVVAASAAGPGDLVGRRLVLLGCPTQRFSISAAMQTFIEKLRPGDLDGIAVAAFDTRFAVRDMPSQLLIFAVRLAGRRAWAATHLARAAEKAGASRLCEPEGFYVRDVEGPLVDGELERATEWGRKLGRSIAGRRIGATFG